MRDRMRQCLIGTGPQLEPDKARLCAIFPLPRPVRVQRALSGLAKSDACSRGPFPLEVKSRFSIRRFFKVRSFHRWAAVISSDGIILERTDDWTTDETTGNQENLHSSAQISLSRIQNKKLLTEISLKARSG